MNNEHSDLEINIIDELKFIFQNKFKLMLISVFFSSVFAFYSMTIPKEYLSTVTFIPSKTSLQTSPSGTMSGLAGLVGIGALSGGPTPTSISLAVLNSRSFLNHFADKNNVNLYLFPEKWDSKKNAWIDGKPDSESIASKIRDMMKISSSQQDIFELEFEWINQNQAAEWANLIIQDLNDHLKEQEIQTGVMKISFLNDQLKKNTINDIDNVFFKMIEDQIKNNMLTNVSDGYAFKVLDDAIVATNNHKPKKIQIIVLGFFVGLFLGIFYLYVIRWLKLN